MNKIKAALAGHRQHVCMGMDRFLRFLDWDQVTNPKDADVLFFTGGEDISPDLYNEERHQSTGFSKYRDTVELDDLNEFTSEGKRKVIGVCRGAQFLTAITGGKLIQVVTDHAGRLHQVMTTDGVLIDVNSYHHQMCLPNPSVTTPLGWALGVAQELHGLPKGMQVSDSFVEPEAFNIRTKELDALCFQYHPEFGSMPKNGMDWTVDKVLKWIGQ